MRHDVADDALTYEQIARWDTNHDGVLDDQERRAAAATLPDPMRSRILELEDQQAVPRPGAPDERASATEALAGFRYFDRDANGVLTEEELTPSMIADWDRNGDGVIEPDEWPVG